MLFSENFRKMTKLVKISLLFKTSYTVGSNRELLRASPLLNPLDQASYCFRWSCSCNL